MKSIIVVLAVLFSAVVFGQTTRLKKADEYYNLKSYALAVDSYENLLGTGVDTPGMKAKLADSYYQMGDLANAEKIYASYVPLQTVSDVEVYQYAQSLKENGKYSESDTWMKQFAVMNPNDARSKDFTENFNYLEQIQKEGSHFTIDSLEINTIQADFGAYPSVDGKKVYFVSSRRDPAFVKRLWLGNERPFLDVYVADQAQTGKLSSPDRISKKVNSVYHEGPLCFSQDGKTVYFTRNNISKGSSRKDQKGLQQLKLYIADVDANGSWKNEREFQYNSKEYSVGHPTLSEDGKTLYFSSNMPGTLGGADIFKCSVDGNDKFGTPENLGTLINTEGQEMFPWAGKDGEFFFSSDGHTGLGGLDVFVVLSDKAGVFRKLLNAGMPINSNNDDFAFTQNPDGVSGYFSSNRSTGRGSDDIYSYILTKPFKTTLMVTGFSVDIAGGIIPGARVNLVDEEGGVLAIATSDDKGFYTFDIDPDKVYELHVEKKDYFPNYATFNTKNLPVNTEEIKQDVNLEKDPGLAVHALVTDAASKLPLEGVSLKMVDNMTNTSFVDITTSASGDVLKGLSGKKINDQISYTITLTKEGYLSKTVVFNAKIAQPGVIEVQNALDLTMSKLEVGGDLAKLIDIKPIYFDLSKYNIRPDAAKELDKIVKIMNQYPTMQVELGSHTDCRGSIASNEKLSDNRAKASAEYVRSRITNPQRIYGKGYGESKLKNGCGCEGPVKSTCSEAEHQENRRTEFIITSM